MEFLNWLFRIHEKAKSEQERKLAEKMISKDMPHVYGLMAVASSSGLTGELAIRAIVPFAPKSISGPIQKSLSHIDAGKSFRHSIEEWNELPHLRPMAHILIESLESGTSSIPAFDALGRDSLNKIRRNCDIAMKKLPVVMLFPLVICILPAFVLLSIVPALVSGFSEIRW